MKSLRNLKRSAIALSLVAGVSFVGSAEAGSLAQATLTLNNFRFLVGGVILDASAFQPGSLTIVDSYSINPALNGTTNAASGSTMGGAPIPQTVRCVPAACPAFLNSGAPFAPISSPTAATGSGSLGAVALNGYPISGIGAPLGATAQTAALSELTSTGNANTQSGLTLNTDFTFTLTQNAGVTIDFDTIAHLYANREKAGNSATATLSWSINIVNNVTGLSVFSWAPDGVLGSGITGGTEQQDQCDINETRQSISGYDCSGHERATTGVLTAGVSYTLSLGHQTISSVTAVVPEPETVALLGLGLVGLGLAQRRRSRKA